MVFVIDTSGSIGFSNFQLIREFVGNITTELISNFPSSSVGVILFDSSAHIHFNLETYTTLNKLLSAIDQLPYNDGGRTNTDEALTLLLSTAQDGTLGLRDIANKVAIIITDGQSTNQSATLTATSALHASDIFEVYAVGVARADLTELEAIASSPEFVLFTSSFDSNNLHQLVDRISLQFCSSKFLITACIYVTGFWKAYNLHINEIIRISEFAPLWLQVRCQQNLFLQCFW